MGDDRFIEDCGHVQETYQHREAGGAYVSSGIRRKPDPSIIVLHAILSWDEEDPARPVRTDLDLHIKGKYHVYYSNPVAGDEKSFLLIDVNAGPGTYSDKPVEDGYLLKGIPDGVYVFSVHNYANRSPTRNPTAFYYHFVTYIDGVAQPPVTYQTPEGFGIAHKNQLDVGRVTVTDGKVAKIELLEPKLDVARAPTMMVKIWNRETPKHETVAVYRHFSDPKPIALIKNDRDIEISLMSGDENKWVQFEGSFGGVEGTYYLKKWHTKPVTVVPDDDDCPRVG